MTDERRAVVVQVTNSAHRGSSGLIRVSMESILNAYLSGKKRLLNSVSILKNCWIPKPE